MKRNTYKACVWIAVLMMLVSLLLLAFVVMKPIILDLVMSRKVAQASKTDELRASLMESYGVTIPELKIDTGISGKKTGGKKANQNVETEKTEPSPADVIALPDDAPEATGVQETPITPEAIGVPEDAPVTEKTDEELQQEIIQRHLNGMIALEEQFQEELRTIAQDTLKEYKSWDKSQKTKSNKIALIKSKYMELANLESDCDRQMKERIGALRDELNSLGYDGRTIAQSFQDYYDDEKAAIIAAYYQEFSNTLVDDKD